MLNLEKKKKALTILVLTVLALSVMATIPIPATAVKVVTDPILEWSPPDGYAVHASLRYDPEWLKVVTETHVSHDTWIHVLGKDAFGEDVEAKTFIPNCTGVGMTFPLVDWHSKQPVTFTKITEVYQQGGEHCNSFEIETLPEPRQDYLGVYDKSTGYQPNYEEGFPVEPSNPDPLKVVTNWNDTNGDGLPQEEECELPKIDSVIFIKGLNQIGEILEVPVNVTTDRWMFEVDTRTATGVGSTWSTVCDVMGGNIKVRYFIFTHPQPQRPILQYKIAVDHIRVTADPKNILADGSSNSTITITLLDIDDHEVHWTTLPWVPPVEINVAATGGKVKPSCDIEIRGCNTHAHTTLISDTNPRRVKVTALAILPEVRDADYQLMHSAMQMKAEDIVCFDGINSVPLDDPWRVVDIGGTGSGKYYAVYIRLDVGCNLISIPVIPDEALTWCALPCASQCLISVAAYKAPFLPNETGKWLYYDFQKGGDIIPIVDGRGYWVKAEKPCTLVLSGKIMDQYDPNRPGFGRPPMYPMGIGWNLVGVTTTGWIGTWDYLDSLNIGFLVDLYGPIWIYKDGRWIRNPSMLRPGLGMWLFTYDGILAP